jgi:hypothetical protein
MSPQDVVLAFIASLGLCLRALRTEFHTVSREAPTAPLTAKTVSSEARRSGRIDGLGAYKLHGIGCRIEMDSGEEVDFDWNERGRAVFDGWRLRSFARSLGLSEIDEAALVAACRELAVAGVLVEAPESGRFEVRS